MKAKMDPATSAQDDLFTSAEWYDRSINWKARLDREIPVFVEVFGPPGEGGLLDAGCGTGRHARALARRGYAVTGADVSEEMLAVARRLEADDPAGVRFVCASFDQLADVAGRGFDGVYCIGNALAASGTREHARRAIERFAEVLRPGGRLFLQVLNFPLLRRRDPCVLGPRVAVVDDREYVSVRHFRFEADAARITNVTLWNDGAWRQRAHTGTLYPVTVEELRAWCRPTGLWIDTLWGGYDGRPFDPDGSTDLIALAVKHAETG